MNRQLHQLLLNLGLNDNEVRVYMLLRSCKQATIPELVHLSEMANITVYRALQCLEGQGLVVSAPINNKQCLYISKPLDALQKNIAKKQRKLRKLELALQKIDKSVACIESSTAYERISLYEGQEAFREQFLSLPSLCTDEYLHIGSVDSLWKASGYSYECPEIRSFVQRRITKNIHARELTLHSPEAERIQQNDSREKRTTVLKTNMPVMKDMLVITDSQVSHFVCEEEPRVIVMRDPALVAVHKQHFTSLWDQ